MILCKNIQNDTIRLRPWQISDIQNLIKYANNPNIAAKMSDVFPHPYTYEQGEKFINRIKEDTPPKIFAIEVNGEVCGSIGVFPLQDINRLNAELGYWLGEEFWGRGIITQVTIEMIQYGFKTFEINRIFARPFPSNPASKRVLEKAGFKLDAIIKNGLVKNNEVFDEIIYAIRKNELL